MRQRAGTDVFAQEKEGGGGIELDLKKKSCKFIQQNYKFMDDVTNSR